MSIIGKLNTQYPKWPTFLANTAVSKVIQLIKNKAIDPMFDDEWIAQKVQSWSPAVKKTAEWILYTLSGAVRTMPEQQHPVGVVIQEALAETLTQVGIKIEEVSMADRMEIIVSTLPMVRAKLVGVAGTDDQFRARIDTILGTVQDWNELLQEADNFVSRIGEKTQTHRTARKARGWWRFL